jgi:hypothetical protein
MAAALGGLVATAAPRSAEACGCFAPPSPAQPVVQAGERIVFGYKDGKVVAHIQIQYQGDAEEFAWLVPVPAVPDLRVGTEELFAQLEQTTAPQFLLQQSGFCGGGGGGFGCAFGADEANLAGSAPREGQEPPVAVEVGSAGPYDYAVVRADEKQPMLDWLNENRFFVPAGTAEAVDPYIRPGSFFLALRLRSGESAGNIQPVVLEYESDFPMIPIILTSVAAVRDMGILVWVLGEHRAVPHNYQHVELNEEYVDWVNGATNYAEVVARAVDEAEGGHAFVTEFAGSTDVMRGVLDPDGRFGERRWLEESTTLSTLMGVLRNGSFPWSQVQAILRKHFPVPAEAIAAGLTPDEYYLNLERNAPTYDPDATFDPMAIAADVWERIVEPTLEAGQLFRDHRMMTRFYTTLDPDEMSKDPVFAFNPDLGDVSRLHQADAVQVCDGDEGTGWVVTLSDGRSYEVETLADFTTRDRTGLPRARLVQVLRQEGAAEVVVDNRAVLDEAAAAAADGGGCRSTPGKRSGAASLLLMFATVLVGRRLFRRRV